MYFVRRIKDNINIAVPIIFSFLVIISINAMLVTTNNNYYSTTNLVYGQPNQMNSITSNQIDIYKIPVEKVHVDDIDIAYKTFGNGSNIILLISGGSNTMNFWDPHLLNELSTNNTVLVYDSRGIGNSTSGNKPFSIKQFANDTVGLLDALKINKEIDILGFSLGSLVAQEIAYMQPERVNGLILYGSLCGGKEAILPSPMLLRFIDMLENPEMKNTSDIQRGKILSDVLFPKEWMQENPNYLERLPKQGVSINPIDATQLKEAFFNWVQTQSCDKLNTIKASTLVIVGTADIATQPGNSLNLVQRIPGAWLVQIKGGGHGLMFQYPEEFARVVQTFLTTTPTS
jgi:pimeloyl-ACP methyl ester carboxylesterase